MVDKTVLATKIAAIRDAVARIQSVLPASAEAFVADRTAREVVTLNLFVALQESISLATHWLADEGREVPASYGEVFRALGAEGAIDADLAARMKSVAGLRNLVAHQYGVLDFERMYAMARDETTDLLALCQALATAASR